MKQGHSMKFGVARNTAAHTPVPHERRPDENEPSTVLFLTANTGGGHRAATEAISQALDTRYPGQFDAVECDPLTGAAAHRFLRTICRWYGPLTREAPWLWSVVFHLTNNPRALGMLRRLIARLAVQPIVASLTRHRPTVVVATHPLLVDAAVAARAISEGTPPVVTVVTDLATAHGTWWHSRVDRTITPSAQLLRAGRSAGAANVHDRPLGIPVRQQFHNVPAPQFADKEALRSKLGLRPGRFLVLVTAGGEGGRGLNAWTRAIVKLLPEVDVAVVCGRNVAVRAQLDKLSARAEGRLRVAGLVDNMSDWLRSADVVVSKAGPSIIAEATSVGVPLLLPAHVPGQEAGNASIVAAAGAARQVRGRRHLIRQIDALQRDTAAIGTMRSAATRFGRPDAATKMAELVADEARNNGAQADIFPLETSTMTHLRKKA